MTVMAATRPLIDGLSETLGREDLLRLIGEEARLIGLSGEEAIAQVRRGAPVRGYIWDDISLLVSLLSE
jgi:hypothetical protein